MSNTVTGTEQRSLMRLNSEQLWALRSIAVKERRRLYEVVKEALAQYLMIWEHEQKIKNEE